MRSGAQNHRAGRLLAIPQRERERALGAEDEPRLVPALLPEQGQVERADCFGRLDQSGFTRSGANDHRQTLAQRQFCEFGAQQHGLPRLSPLDSFILCIVQYEVDSIVYVAFFEISIYCSVI